MNNYRAAGCIINEGNINGITFGNEDQDLVYIRLKKKLICVDMVGFHQSGEIIRNRSIKNQINLKHNHGAE